MVIVSSIKFSIQYILKLNLLQILLLKCELQYLLKAKNLCPLQFIQAKLKNWSQVSENKSLCYVFLVAKRYIYFLFLYLIQYILFYFCYLSLFLFIYFIYLFVLDWKHLQKTFKSVFVNFFFFFFLKNIRKLNKFWFSMGQR